MLTKPVSRGIYSVSEVGENSSRLLFSSQNLVMLDAACIMSRLLSGDPAFKIGAMYIEFENVANPGDTAVIPSFTHDESVEYYLGLSGQFDYFRVRLVSTPALTVVPGSQDFFTGTGDKFNRVSFFAQTGELIGVNGLPFSASHNSKVKGIALVATPKWEDQTRDLIYGRSYFSAGNQIAKRDSHHIAIHWNQDF